MKTKQMVQWAVFSVVALAVLLGGGGVMGMIIGQTMGLAGPGLLLAMIAGAGWGAIWVVCVLQLWLWLVEHGWFFKEKE